MTIIDFLLARIAEDEAAAQAAINSHAPDEVWESELGSLNLWPEDIAFWAIQTPYRSLAECAAKRAIVDGEFWEPRERPSDSELHRRHAHPAYEYETTEGPRKRWDDPDEPPEGEGWERNVDAGRPGEGWDRFEYTEESYWRRLKPEAERREWREYIPNAFRAIASVYQDHPDYRQEWALAPRRDAQPPEHP